MLKSIQLSLVLSRSKFLLVLGKAEGLADAIQEKGFSEAIDIDDAGMRLTLDVVGLVCYLFINFVAYYTATRL